VNVLKVFDYDWGTSLLVNGELIERIDTLTTLELLKMLHKKGIIKELKIVDQTT
jgi:hypothetical protein